jgi:hypothetical protein
MLQRAWEGRAEERRVTLRFSCIFLRSRLRALPTSLYLATARSISRCLSICSPGLVAAGS